MNEKVGMSASAINVICVGIFAVSMLFKADFVSYLSSMGIAFSFVVMIAAFSSITKGKKRVFADSAKMFAAIYATIILIVYFAQVTTVNQNALAPNIAQLIDYSQFGLFFNYNLLGYGLMALSTFFIGFTIQVTDTRRLILKRMLIIHGIVFISCLIVPMLGLFSNDANDMDWIGVLILEFWCLYFIPIGILSYLHFNQAIKEGSN